MLDEAKLCRQSLGYLPVYKGSVKLDGADWKLGDTNYSVKNGFIYLPEERKKQGILPVLSIKDNISVSVLDNLKSGISISRKKENELAIVLLKLMM